jgi:6-pyruvoyltetrahydropterin/6-carboxytetrahydropterin synthase
MTYLKHTFDFAASHRLHNPLKSDEENLAVFGKCNNPHGHGHNYRFEVTLRGEPDDDGFLINFYELERIVDEAVVEPLDHKHLNIEVDEFREGNPDRLNPSVEFIAKVIYQRLTKALGEERADLDAVTVWETDKTWCEYREPAGV